MNTQVLKHKDETEHLQNCQTVKIGHYLGNGLTNNRAEYQGLCCGLERAAVEARKLVESLSTTSNIALTCEVHGDSQVRQMTGEFTAAASRALCLLNQIMVVAQATRLISLLHSTDYLQRTSQFVV